MTGFEPRTSGIGSDRFTNWAITTAPNIVYIMQQLQSTLILNLLTDTNFLG